MIRPLRGFDFGGTKAKKVELLNDLKAVIDKGQVEFPIGGRSADNHLTGAKARIHVSFCKLDERRNISRQILPIKVIGNRALQSCVVRDRRHQLATQCVLKGRASSV